MLSEAFSEQRKRALAVGILAVIVVVLGIQTIGQAYRVDGCDFTSYLLSAKALWHGDNPYKTDTPYNYMYPLFLAFLLGPLAVLPYGLANLVWFVLSIASLFLVCQMLWTLAADDIRAAPTANSLLSGVVICLVMLSPIQNNLRNGQVNLIVLFCCAMFLKSFVARKKTLAAAWLGAAVALKIVPAILFCFLLVRGQWRVMFLTTLFAALFCWLPVIVGGPNIVSDYLEFWKLLWSAAQGHVPKNGMFFGLRGAIEYLVPVVDSQLWVRVVNSVFSLGVLLLIDFAGRRRASPAGLQSPGTGPFFGEITPAIRETVGRKHGPVPFVSGLWQSPGTGPFFGEMPPSGRATVGRKHGPVPFVSGLCSSPGVSPAVRDAWAFSGYLVGCLLLSPTAEIHHLVLAFPAVFLVGLKAIHDPRWRTRPVLALIVLFLAFFDVGATLFPSGPFFFMSLATLLPLLFLANRHSEVAEGTTVPIALEPSAYPRS
jgi:hypothetical protein